MKLLKWLFDGPRIRAKILKKITEKEHLIDEYEEVKTMTPDRLYTIQTQKIILYILKDLLKI
jgi:hypothetical protein